MVQAWPNATLTLRLRLWKSLLLLLTLTRIMTFVMSMASANTHNHAVTVPAHNSRHNSMSRDSNCKCVFTSHLALGLQNARTPEVRPSASCTCNEQHITPATISTYNSEGHLELSQSEASCSHRPYCADSCVGTESRSDVS